jgi:hypothetical protein
MGWHPSCVLFAPQWQAKPKKKNENSVNGLAKPTQEVSEENQH